MPNRPAPVLIVDDRDENLLALTALLAGPGIEVLRARSGTEALELLLTHDVALALLDVQMPEMDGFELAELMRGAERTRDVPIIFVTAGEHDRHRVFRGYESGAVDFLHKPIEPHVLRNKVAVFVQMHRQKRQLAADLAERSEMLRFNETFSAVLGHDLRGPLSAMMMSALVLEKRVDGEVAKKAAARIAQSGKRMSRMIDDLLDLARARLANGIPIERRTGDLAGVWLRIVEEQRASHPDRRIAFAADGDGDGDGEWDADRLAQVATNLIGNAVRHGDPAGPVEVTFDGHDADEVRIVVANEGAIAADLIPQLFVPFRQGRTHSAASEGLGLGLFIVERIVSGHGGSIDVASADGRTTFTIRLPRRPPAG